MDREKKDKHPYMDMLPDILPDSISFFLKLCRCIKRKSSFTNPLLPIIAFNGKVEEHEFYIRIPRLPSQ